MRHFNLMQRGIFFVCTGLTAWFLLGTANAATVDDLKKQIEAKSGEITRLQAEAAKYNSALQETAKQANTLQSRIKTLDQSLQKTGANIKVTNAKIEKTTLEIKALGEDIGDKEDSIGQNRERLKALLAEIAESDRQSPIEIIVREASIAEFFAAIDTVESMQSDMKLMLEELKRDRDELKNKKTDAEGKKRELNGLAAELADQKAIQEGERRERQNLLTETKNQERQYQALLADVAKRRSALQSEIDALESEIKRTFDPSSLPKTGGGVLSWPVPHPVFITQHFGNTPFALSGAYSGKGHNGIDLRAPVGTPILAAESGVVRGIGDTDIGCRRASYGRWALIDHPNNLATLYAHMSLIKVTPGERVARGDVIGYAGQTGYATGPHLHFSVYASEAVEIGTLKSKTCGRNMTLPLSPFNGYLDPRNYLPAI